MSISVILSKFFRNQYEAGHLQGLDSLELPAFDESTIKELQNIRRMSKAEIAIKQFGKDVVFIGSALTIIPGLYLIANHLLTAFTSTPFQTLVDKYVNKGKSLVAIKNQYDTESSQVKMAEYKFNKACCKIVERVWQQGVRSETFARNREFLAATLSLVQRATEKQDGGAYLQYETEQALKETYIRCRRHCLLNDAMKHHYSPEFPTKPQV